MNIRFSKLAVVAAFVFCSTAFGQKEVSISAIQGSGLESSYKGQQVRTTGVVTARIRNGFFLQSPDDKADADPNTVTPEDLGSAMTGAGSTSAAVQETAVVEEGEN